MGRSLLLDRRPNGWNRRVGPRLKWLKEVVEGLRRARVNKRQAKLKDRMLWKEISQRQEVG